jgi:hypothetical protein
MPADQMSVGHKVFDEKTFHSSAITIMSLGGRKQMVDKTYKILAKFSTFCQGPMKRRHMEKLLLGAGNTKGGSITELLTFCLTGLESAV